MEIKPEPLDLEDLKKIIPDDECNVHLRDNHWIPEIKQRIKSACEFYLRYKDNPELFLDEKGFPNDSEGIGIFNYWKSLKLIPPTMFTEFDWIEYNEWLFKLAFKGVWNEERLR